MKHHHTTDWTKLAGAHIEIRTQGRLVDTGYVDCVTADGAILWLISAPRIRKLYEKAELHEAWVIEDPAATGTGPAAGSIG